MKSKISTVLCLIPLLMCLSACAGGHGTGGGGGGTGTTPSITSQPSNQTVTAPATATFSAGASGTAPLTYAWQSAPNGSATFTAIAGAANSASYTTPATATGQSGTQFRVVVSNGIGTATSSAAILTVNAAASTAPSITVQPANQTVTAGLTATFTVTASGSAPLSYQWQSEASGAGSFSNVGAASATPGLSVANTTVGMSGTQYRVVVSNGVNPAATSNAATLTVNPVNASSVRVLTFHNDVERTGQNLSETILTTTNVNSTSFGLVGTITVDGLVDAEPLYVGGLTISGATHNVVFIATENDSVYAFDADTFTMLWRNQLLSGTSPAEVASDNHGCDQVVPIIGVTATPVIDLNAGPNGTIFVVAMSKTSGGTYHQRIHALDLLSGADRMAATDIQATFSGTGTGSSGGIQTFNPGSYEERAALLLLNGTIYTTWTSHCDATPYNSWVIGFNETNLARNTILDMTANGASAAGHGGQEGGIWMAGAGPAADSSGNIYLLIGNGTFDTTLNGSNFPNMCDFGNSFMKLSTGATGCNGTSLGVADYFTMHNACCGSTSESFQDTDLGSGGVVVLPDLQNGATTFHLAVGAGKDGNLYVVNRDNMGKFNSSSDSAIYQELGGALSGGVWSTPAYFNNTVYYGPVDNSLLAFPITNAQLGSTPKTSTNTFGYPGTMPSISANGSGNGIVWALDTGTTGTLFAYNAATMAQLFSGTFTATASAKFATPMIANGKVYAGTGPTSGSNGGSVAVFGLLNPSAKLLRKNGPARSPQNRLPAPVVPHPGSSTPGE